MRNRKMINLTYMFEILPCRLPILSLPPLKLKDKLIPTS